jgi:phosphoribosyl 1,2-cyclic phosphodiesterase
MLKVGPYPYYLKQRILSNHGHLCNEMAGKVVSYLAEQGTKRFVLGHLSKENNFPELAYQTSLNALVEKGIEVGREVTLEVASREHAGAVITL